MKDTDNPDLEKLASNHLQDLEEDNSHQSFIAGFEKAWNDFVVPERKSHQIELSNYAYQIDRAKRDRDNAEAESMRLKNDLLDALDLKEGKGPTALSMLSAERDRLKAELDTAKELLWSIHRSLYIGPDLRDKEIMLHYIGVASVIKEEIEGFLKDKK